jgi:hypothetical protein
MKKLIALTSAALAIAGCMNERPEQAAARAERTNMRLADELRGRTAEPAVSCVNQRDLRGNRSVGEGAILFDGPTSRVVYVNRPPSGCPELSSGRALITRTPSTRLCEGDIVTVFDPVSRSEYGSCGLGQFTPYRRAG